MKLIPCKFMKTIDSTVAGFSFFACLLFGGCVVGDKNSGNAVVKADPFASSAEPTSQKTDKAEWKVVFEADWSDETIGEEPADLFVLDGSYVISEKDGNKALALPGAPVGDFGFLFGPRVKGKPVELKARIFSTRKGRRMPAFAAGLGGVNSYRLRLNPAAKTLHLSRGEEILEKVPLEWKSGLWTNLRFRAEPKGDEGAILSAKVWSSDETEPADWALAFKDSEPFAGGKCTLWGYPYAGTEIFFDDLSILIFSSEE